MYADCFDENGNPRKQYNGKTDMGPFKSLWGSPNPNVFNTAKQIVLEELEKYDIKVKLIHDIEFSRGFPSKNISDWFRGDKKFNELQRFFCSRKKY